MTPIDGIIGTGLGLLLQESNDKRQINQQKKLQEMQIQGQMKLGEFNRSQAMKMWEATNYAAQRKQLEKAGLNVGLMYGSAGAGGTTQGAGAGNVTGGQAPVGGGEIGMAMQLGLQQELQKAQIENIKANTGKTKAETPTEGQIPEKIGKEIEATTTGIELAKQQTSNAKATEALTNIQKEIADIDRQIKNQTKYDEISTIQALRDTAIQNVKIIENQADISTETKQSIIKQAKQSVIETAVNIAAKKIGIQQTQEQIKQIAQNIMTQQVGLSQTERKLRLEQIMTEYNAGQPAQNKRSSETIKNYVNMLTDFLGAIMPNN